MNRTPQDVVEDLFKFVNLPRHDRLGYVENIWRAPFALFVIYRNTLNEFLLTEFAKWSEYDLMEHSGALRRFTLKMLDIAKRYLEGRSHHEERGEAIS